MIKKDIRGVSPGEYFWEDFGCSNRLCMALGREHDIHEIKDTVPAIPLRQYIAVKYTGPKGKGIRYVCIPDGVDHTSFYETPLYATVENGKDVPWKYWEGTEEEMDFHAFHVIIEGREYTDTDLSMENLTQSLVDLLYEYSDQKYTKEYLHGLSIYQKIDYAKTVVLSNPETLSKLIIA